MLGNSAYLCMCVTVIKSLEWMFKWCVYDVVKNV